MAGVDEESREVDLLQEAQLAEEGGMDCLPDVGKEPRLETSPAGHPAATTHFLGEVFPRDTGLEYKENTCESFAIVQGWSSALGTWRPLGKERLNQFPEIIR